MRHTLQLGLLPFLGLFVMDGRAVASGNAAWTVETVDESGDVGSYAAIAIDLQDRPVVAYRDETGRALRIRRKTAGGWGHVIVPPDPSGNFGVWPALAVDSGGGLQIVYHEEQTYGLHYIGWNGIEWTEVENVLAGGPFASIAVDLQGIPHVAFLDFPGGFPVYATRTGAVWSVEYFDFIDTSAYTSLSLDRTGTPHVSYSRLGEYFFTLMHARRLGDGTWEKRVVLADPAHQPIYTSLAVDPLDRIHIAFHDADEGTLVYTLIDGADTTFAVVDSGGVGEYASLALDASMVPHIAYYDFTGQDLRYVSGDDWVPVTVDSAGVVGQYASLALDSHGAPHIAYYDLTNRNLKHAWVDPPSAVEPVTAGSGLLSAHPNPLLPGEGAFLSLDLPRAAAAELAVFDVRGRRVRTLVRGDLGAGVHSFHWDGRRDDGSTAPAGVYFVRLRAGGAESRIKVVLLR